MFEPYPAEGNGFREPSYSFQELGFVIHPCLQSAGFAHLMLSCVGTSLV